MHDIVVNRDLGDNIFIINKTWIPYLRNGLSLIEKISPNQVSICRKGLFKLFDFHEKLLEIFEVSENSKAISKILLKPCARALRRGKISSYIRFFIRNL